MLKSRMFLNYILLLFFMTGKLILPPNYEKIEKDLIFLFGPIQGAPDWQSKSVEYLHGKAPEVNIANPRREYLPGDFSYDKQVMWERYYAKVAMSRGVSMFWLPNEIEHNPERAYAQTTRVEFGWITGMKEIYKKINIKMAVGIEKGFSGEKYFRYVLEKEHPDVRVYDNLEETCKDALFLLGKKVEEALLEEKIEEAPVQKTDLERCINILRNENQAGGLPWPKMKEVIYTLTEEKDIKEFFDEYVSVMKENMQNSGRQVSFLENPETQAIDNVLSSIVGTFNSERISGKPYDYWTKAIPGLEDGF